MLGDLIRGLEKSPVVIIKDSFEWQGRPLCLSFISALAKRVEEVVLFTYEKPSLYFDEALPHSVRERVHIVDGFGDPLGWQHGGSPAIDGEIASALLGIKSPGVKRVGVVIDSLMFHVLNRPPSYSCQLLHALKTSKLQDCEIIQTVCLLHEDLHDDTAVCLIEHVATSVIKLLPPRSHDFKYTCSIVHQRGSGKVIKVTENFHLDDQNTLTMVMEAKPVFTMARPDTTASTDPSANLPFNLSLTDKEKQDRSNVKLPYIQTHDKVHVSEGDTGSKIFYQPDVDDDLDEEDPDDDLDI